MADVEKASAPLDTTDDETQAPPPPYAPQSYGATGVPPSYDQYQAVDAPPSYDSIYGRVRAAKAESTGVVDFFKKFVILLLSTIGCTIFVAIFLAIPVSMIAMGSVYVHSCAYEHYIPIYLIVGGCFGVVKNLSSMAQQIKNKRENREGDNAKTNPFDGALNCFLFAWFIAAYILVASLVALVIPICMITIGSIYRKECPFERYIHIYLIVAGAVGIVQVILSVIQRVNPKTGLVVFQVLLSLFGFSWFIAGNVWVYGSLDAYDAVDNTSRLYCNPTLYWFAFWLLTVSYIYVVFALLVYMCALLIMSNTK